MVLVVEEPGVVDQQGDLDAVVEVQLGQGQRQALSYLAIRLYSAGFGFALLFFAGFLSTLPSASEPATVPVLAGVCMT
jgi:hypothetical protein